MGLATMKPASARHRVDLSSGPLIALLLASGVNYMGLGGAIDGAAYLGNVVALCDFKTGTRAKLTKTQTDLVAKGVPIWFLATDNDVLQLVRWMREIRA